MSIRTKLILLITVILCLVGFGMGSFIYWQNNKVLTEHINTDIENNINYTSQLINFYIGRVNTNLTSLASDPLVLKALETKDPAVFSQVSDKLNVIKETVGLMENLSLMEISGSSCIARSANKSGMSALGRDFSERDYCKGIIKNNSTYLSSAYISTITGNPVLGLVVPVRNNQGKMLGFVYGSIGLSELRGYLWDLQVNSKVELLDRYGVMFLNTEEKIQKLGELSESEKTELSEIKSSIDSKKMEGHFRDEDNFVGFKSDGLITIIYEKSVANLLILTQTLNFTVLISLLLIIILTIIAIFFFVRPITNRISRLSKITRDIASGNLNIKINEKDLKAKDETAVLARSFNDMAKKLAIASTNTEKKIKERTADLEKLNRFMTGREIKMIELKKQIQELKEKK